MNACYEPSDNDARASGAIGSLHGFHSESAGFVWLRMDAFPLCLSREEASEDRSAPVYPGCCWLGVLIDKSF